MGRANATHFHGARTDGAGFDTDLKQPVRNPMCLRHHRVQCYGFVRNQSTTRHRFIEAENGLPATWLSGSEGHACGRDEYAGESCCAPSFPRTQKAPRLQQRPHPVLTASRQPHGPVKRSHGIVWILGRWRRHREDSTSMANRTRSVPGDDRPA